jgi:hypothetical protein
VKTDTGESAGLKCLAAQKRDPAFDRAALLTEKAGLIGNAQESVQSLGGTEKRVCAICSLPERPNLF